MATTLMPLDPATSPQHATRLLPIAADLLPAEVRAARRAGRVRLQVLAVLAVFAVLLGGWYATAVVQASTAADELEHASGQVAVLTQRQRQYAEVVDTQNQSKQIRGKLAQLLAEDLRWAGLVNSLRAAGAGSGVKVTGMSGALVSAAGGTAEPQLPSAGGGKVIATLTVSGVGGNKDQVAAYVDALGDVDVFAQAFLTSATEADGDVQFNVRVDVTAGALGGRYTAKTKGQGGK